ncbi:MAG: hypothetical protein IT361_02075 [Gemmatimonadaceae bacterium]|nr:hypothetical protein [Gemmatimonadaceae bacterium]
MPDDRPRESGPPPTVLSPAALDRGALDRVLARAAELNAGILEPAEGMTEAQLVELGKEVGIGAEHIRQAIAEERTRIAAPRATGMVGAIYGASAVMAARIVQGTPASVLAALDQWMQREEILRPKRRLADRLTWEARRDLVGNLQAGFNFSGRAYALKSATEVGATVVAVDAQRCLVTLDADFTDSRGASVAGSAVGASLLSGGGAAVVGLAAMSQGGSMLIAGIVATLAVGVSGAIVGATGEAHKRKVRRAQLALEQVLDRLEHGEIKRPASNPLVDLLSTITR